MKRRPQARLSAVATPKQEVADWASLFGDLSRRKAPVPGSSDPIEWRVHDRTHVEFAIDYPIGEKENKYTWEAYFFVPESFRLDSDTYDKKAIYGDLWSYVRYAVPAVSFYDLPDRGEGTALDRVRATLYASAGTGDSSEESSRATCELRLFACQVRSAGLSAMREAEHVIATDPDEASAFVANCTAVAAAFRQLIDETRTLELSDEVRIAASWCDEDVSLVLETFTATLGVQLESASTEAAKEAASALATHAVLEARHRRDSQYDSVGQADAEERDIEHFEFRRHMLKRFTASALWLTLEVHKATGAWVVHAVYAIAAAAAMTFALTAGAQLKSAATQGLVLRYAIPMVIAYAAKDRLKALLQSVFADWIAKRYPDRRWSITDRERKLQVGRVDERASLKPFEKVEHDVLKVRRRTREHALEEHARPERVLWHKKTVTVAPRAQARDGTPFSLMTEIFRLNLSRWLSHTDDPNRKIVFADPEDARVYTATARRVYNVNVVYRLSGDEGGPWHRIRVVVSRKGIERIEPIC